MQRFVLWSARRFGSCLLVACAAALLPAVAAHAQGRPQIRVLPGGWGCADTGEVRAVLESVVDVLVPEAAPHLAHTLVVGHATAHPLTRFERGPQGEYRIDLSATDRRWDQYAYQFGHELCHVMSRYGEHGGGAKRNQWFEESLCEAAALHTLRALERRWAHSPPFPQWRDYAPAFGRYASLFLAEPHRRAAEREPLAGWLSAHLAAMERDPYRRRDNEVVAGRLLSLFESLPGSWAALYALNRDPSDADATLSSYLGHWHDNAPDRFRPLVATIREQLTGTAPGRGHRDLPPVMAGAPRESLAGPAGPVAAAR